MTTARRIPSLRARRRPDPPVVSVSSADQPVWMGAPGMRGTLVRGQYTGRRLVRVATPSVVACDHDPVSDHDPEAPRPSTCSTFSAFAPAYEAYPPAPQPGPQPVGRHAAPDETTYQRMSQAPRPSPRAYSGADSWIA